MHPYVNIRYVLWVLVISLQVAAADIDEETRLGLIVGCAVGGVVLLAILTLFFCLICRTRAAKQKKVSKHSYNGTTTSPSSQMSVPPGIWTSSPSMVAGQQPQPPMGYAPPSQGKGSGGRSIPPHQQQQQEVKRPKRLPRDGKPPGDSRYQSQDSSQLPQPNKQTLAFKREHENTQENGLQPKRDSQKAKQQEVDADKAVQSRGQSGLTRNDMNGVNGGGLPLHQTQPAMQPYFSAENPKSSTLPARIEETDEDDSSPGAPAGPFVAKAFSNYRKSHPDPEDSNMARVFSSYTTLDSHRDPYQSRVNIHAGKQPNPLTKSDTFLQRKGRPVSRTHSDLSKAQLSGPQQITTRPLGPVGGSWNPYGQGVLIRSQGWQPEGGGSRKTHSLDRKPKAVFAPPRNKQGGGYMWSANSNAGQGKHQKTPPKKARKPDVSKKLPQQQQSSLDRDAKKAALRHVVEDESRPVQKAPGPKVEDVYAKPNKAKGRKSAVDIGHQGGVSAIIAKQGNTGGRPTHEDSGARDMAETRKRIKSSSSTDGESTDGKEVTIDAFKFLEEFEDGLSNGDTNE